MSRMRSAILFASLLTFGCGSDEPVVYEQTIINETLTVSAGTSNSVVFTVDLTEVTNVSAKGYFEADGTVRILVLSEAEFKKWVANETYTSLYSSDELDTISFLVPLTESGRYNVVISNTHDTLSAKQVGAYVSLTYQDL